MGKSLKKSLGVVWTVIKEFLLIQDKKDSKKIEEKANKKIDALSYNKKREDMVKKLEEVKSFVIDETIDITNVTYFAKIQAVLSEVLSYKTLLTPDEINKLKNSMDLIKHDRIDKHDRKDIIECLNYFIYELSKGDIAA